MGPQGTPGTGDRGAHAWRCGGAQGSQGGLGLEWQEHQGGLRATAGVELGHEARDGQREELGGGAHGTGVGAEHPLPAQPHTPLS